MGPAAGPGSGDPAAYRRGVLAAVASYLLWGLSPIYWKALAEVPAIQQLAHRVVWCAILLAVVLALQGRWRRALATLGRPRVVLMLIGSTGLIATNWLVYIWAVATERILHASLGYFVNPLVSVLLGVVFLGERLTRSRVVALGLATVGVGVLAGHLGSLPWISLVLAFTFGFYGLLRKQMAAGPLVGLLVETTLLSPVMLWWLWRAEGAGEGAFGHLGAGMDLLLISAGAITAVPLLLFAYGARRLPLATVGFLQYLAPTGQFLLAVLVYREVFTVPHLVAFLLIWAGLGLFLWGERRVRRK